MKIHVKHFEDQKIPAQTLVPFSHNTVQSTICNCSYCINIVKAFKASIIIQYTEEFHFWEVFLLFFCTYGETFMQFL